MNALLAVVIVLFVYAIGDIIAAKTKGVLSMIIVGSVVFMVAFWCGLPKTIFDDSTFTVFNTIALGMFLVHIGTTIKISDFISQWKTVIIVGIATVAACVGVYFIGSLFVDKYYALISGPVVGGGFVAYMVMSDIAEAVNREDVVVFGIMVLTFQSFIGLPLASVFCKKEALRLKGMIDNNTLIYAGENQDNSKKAVRLIPAIPDKYNGPNLILFKLALLSYISSVIANVSGINNLIICLILGVVCRLIGLLEENALVRANALAFVMIAAFSSIFSGLAQTSPTMVLDMLIPLLSILVLGAAVLGISGIIVGRILKYSWYMSMALALSAMFGFPGTFLISQEVCNNTGENEEEKKILQDNIMPKMIVAGIVSVSVVSGLVAGIMVNWI